MAGQADELGDAIADTLTNALKSIPELTVLDTEAMAQAVKSLPELDIIKKDADAISFGEQLSLQMVVVGSYQQIGERMRIDARILSVVNKRPVAGEPIAVSAPYPAGYFEALSQLSSLVLKTLRVELTPAAQRKLESITKSTTSAEAQQLYNRATRRARGGTKTDLREAIELFDEALAKDPDFGLVYAAKAETENKLAELNRIAGDDPAGLNENAARDAARAVQKAPNLTRGYQALANARSILGQYELAGAAARQAVVLTPNDASALIALARALGRGALQADENLDRAFHLQPGMSFVLRECPKLTVVNNTGGDLAVTLSPIASAAKKYPILKIAMGASRRVAVLPGSFLVVAQCADADLSEERRFEAGAEYKLTYTGDTCAKKSFPAFVVKNTGTDPITVQISGITNSLLLNQILPGGKERRMTVIPGEYSMSVGAEGVPSSVSKYTLTAKDEETLEYSVVTEVR